MPRPQNYVPKNSPERRLLITKALVKDILSPRASTTAASGNSSSSSSSTQPPWWKRYFGCFSRSCRRSSPSPSSTGGRRSIKTKTKYKYKRINNRSKSIKK